MNELNSNFKQFKNNKRIIYNQSSNMIQQRMNTS
jgi:hypothetical protein